MHNYKYLEIPFLYMVSQEGKQMLACSWLPFYSQFCSKSSYLPMGQTVHYGQLAELPTILGSFSLMQPMSKALPQGGGQGVVEGRGSEVQGQSCIARPLFSFAWGREKRVWYINDTISVQTSTQSRVGYDWCQQQLHKHLNFLSVRRLRMIECLVPRALTVTCEVER